MLDIVVDDIKNANSSHIRKTNKGLGDKVNRIRVEFEYVW